MAETRTSSADSLAREHCSELPTGTPALAADQVRSLHAALSSDWHVGDGELRREFAFRSFNGAFGLATRVALLAEAEKHHPDMEVGWGRLVVRLSTHSVGGLSRNDFIMAARIDRLGAADT
jgi:4a-hydroxytetrahydrobiopterin dehydratase